MRLVGVVFAALVALGLAALQKTDGPGSLVTRAAHVMLSSRSQEPILGPTAAAPVSPAPPRLSIRPHRTTFTPVNPDALGTSRDRDRPRRAVLHSGPSTSSNTISCATRKWC